MEILVFTLSMLLVGVVALLIRNFPSYKWNYTCRALFEHFEHGVLDNLHKLIDTMGPDLDRMFETTCLEKIDEEIKKMRNKYNSFFLLDSCIRQHERSYKEELLNHIMRNKHKIENNGLESKLV